MNKAVFLDRDGTIAVDAHYCSRPENFVFIPTVLEGFRLLSATFFKIIIVTNQSGIARGYFSEEMLSEIHDKMNAEVIGCGGRIDAVYYCPHHPDDKCKCRKPEIGMLQQASKDWDIDLQQSYLVGDKYLDVEAANKAGCKAVIVPNTEPELKLLEGSSNYKGKLDFIGTDFISAVKWIIADEKKQGIVSVGYLA